MLHSCPRAGLNISKSQEKKSGIRRKENHPQSPTQPTGNLLLPLCFLGRCDNNSCRCYTLQVAAWLKRYEAWICWRTELLANITRQNLEHIQSQEPCKCDLILYQKDKWRFWYINRLAHFAKCKQIATKCDSGVAPLSHFMRIQFMGRSQDGGYP